MTTYKTPAVDQKLARRAAATIPAQDRLDPLRQAASLIDPTSLEVMREDKTLAEIFADAGHTPATAGHQSAPVDTDELPAHEVPAAAWDSMLASILDIHLRPWRGEAGIGYDPISLISQAIAEHLNVYPAGPDEDDLPVAD
ncbi:hypothetical protein G3A39_42765 [Paraburkholderia aspalathi]|nr:hypothetical protein [Paraburkholderia aspalathi]